MYYQEKGKELNLYLSGKKNLYIILSDQQQLYPFLSDPFLSKTHNNKTSKIDMVTSQQNIKITFQAFQTSHIQRIFKIKCTTV